MLVVICQDASGILELPRRLDSVCIVITEYSLSIRLMERERVANAVRDLRGRIDLPCLDLEPIPIALVDDLVVKIDQGFDAGIPMRGS